MGDFLTNPTADIPATRVGHELSVREALLDIRTALAALGGGPPPVYTTGTRPVAAAGNFGTFIIVRDTGLDDVLQMCRRLTGGTYEWIPVAY